MSFFGFLRSAEIVVPSGSGFDPSEHLTYGDVKVDSITSPRYLEVCIKASKQIRSERGSRCFSGEGPAIYARCRQFGITWFAGGRRHTLLICLSDMREPLPRAQGGCSNTPLTQACISY